MTSTVPAPASTSVLDQIEQRVLWLSSAIVHHANRVRPNPSGLKVGGHQASCASMVSIMTSLWFRHLAPGDRVSVKPHASPVLHAINYLLGELDEAKLSTLREFGGLQSYPSRSKDPDPVDYSTGSVGIGATAPIWGAVSRRYLRSSLGASTGRGRQFSLVGDAELDEGAVWEAILDPAVAELGEVVWIVDLNRQSLDRVVPNIAADRLHGMFAAAGWQVLTLKYGRLLEELFTKPGGAQLRERIDGMSNPEYQRLLRCSADELRARVPGDGDGASLIAGLIAELDDTTLVAAIRNLGGHDLDALDKAFGDIDDNRPTVIFAYTVKGYRLPVQGHPQNHSSLLTEDQMQTLAGEVGVDPAQPWQRFDPSSPAGRTCADTVSRLRREPVVATEAPAVPQDIGRPAPSGVATTQAALGRALLDLTRSAPDAARRVVTVSPDVSSTTNLGGWVNKVGVWSATERQDWFADDAETILHWRENPAGQHIELGIAETNLVGLLGELGATWSRWGEPLLPIGVMYDPCVERALEPWSATERQDWFADDAETILHWRENPAGQHIELGIAETNLVGLLGELGATWSRWGEPLLPIGVMYDPFVERALEPWSFGIYAGGQSILVGTPSGVTLAPEGGAHQSIKTPSIGIEQPGCVTYEPAFAIDVEWTLLDSMARLGRPDGGSSYLRLSTRPVDQTLAAVPTDPAARERRRRQVVAGGYPLRRRDGAVLTIAAMGAMVTEALEAADRLEQVGIVADVVCVTSPDLLFRALRARQGREQGPTWILDQLFPQDRATPMVTLLDGHPHTLAFLASIRGVRSALLGVTGFGQSGSLEDVYRHHGINTDAIVSAALDLTQ